MHFVVVGTPGDRRVDLFQAALAAGDHPPADLVSYRDLLLGKADLRDVVRPGSVVRIESPGRDFVVEKLLLAAGADAEGLDGYARLGCPAIEALEFERGRMTYSRQWYLGLRSILARVEAQLSDCPAHLRMNHIPDILLMFDKCACHSWLHEHAVPVPRSLDPIESYEALLAAMRSAGCCRVFVKLAHGSSASGVVAYQWSGDRHQATTTVEMVSHQGQPILYNSRRIQTYRDQATIARLIDALCQHRIHVEQWLPKAAIENKVFDLRVVVIAGGARHTVVRLSDSPMTNLHLLNQRAGIDLIFERLGPKNWAAIQAACERVMTECFPSSLYAGLDVLVTSDYQRHAVLEVNAFGDLLPDVLDRGQDTYAAEIKAVLDRCHA